jgi:hypothetical protein
MIVADVVEALVRWLDHETKEAASYARGEGE